MTDEKPKKVIPKNYQYATAAQRKAKERAQILALAENGEPHEWDRRACILILNSLNSKKFTEEHRRNAWIQLGKINNWIETP